MIKQFLLITLFVGCANHSVKNESDNLSKSEKNRALYYKRLRLKGARINKIKTPKIKLSKEEKIILTQHIQMNCFKKRVDQKKCDTLLTKKPKPCLKLLKRKKISKITACLDKNLFNK